MSKLSLVSPSHKQLYIHARKVGDGSVLLGDDRKIAQAMLAAARADLSIPGFTGRCGRGISAPQLGVDLSAMVINVADDEQPPRFELLVNPRVGTPTAKADRQGKSLTGECCDSTGKYAVIIKRYDVTRLGAYTIDGEQQEYRLKGSTAHWAQHHLDHLLGHMGADSAERRATQWLYIVEDNEVERYYNEWRQWRSRTGATDWLNLKQIK